MRKRPNAAQPIIASKNVEGSGTAATDDSEDNGVALLVDRLPQSRGLE